MSRTFNITFSEPELLIDPDQKSVFDEEEDVYYSQAQITIEEDNSRIGLVVLSPDDQAMKDFTTPFIAIESDQDDADSEQNEKVIVVQRKISSEAESHLLENSDIVLGVNIAEKSGHSQQGVVIKFDIDPPIRPGRHHVFMFTQKRDGDYIEVSATMNVVACKLYNNQPTQLSQLISNLDRVRTRSADHVGREVIKKSELQTIIANMGQAVWNEPVENRFKKRANLKDFEDSQFTLVIKNANNDPNRTGESGKTSQYDLIIRI